MSDKKDRISRRKFLERSMIGLGSMAASPIIKRFEAAEQEWPESEFLARNTVFQPNTIPIRTEPFLNAPEVRKYGEDECLPWLKEVIGENPIWSPNKRWVETPEGYIYAPSVQKVKNIPNQPLDELPQHGEEPGMWVEVTVPFVNLSLINATVYSPLFQNTRPELWRLYYGQVMWVDKIFNENGNIEYQVKEKHGTYGDVFRADATAFRMITPEEIVPINPNVTDKKIVVNVEQQSLSCYEGGNEVYFCRVSTGVKKDIDWTPVDYWRTPPGTHWINRKLVSLHMSANDGQGTAWDLFGVAWTSLFAAGGVAIHSTFWHNDFGNLKSHGCVNALPEDAKWIFRWTTPVVNYYEGDMTDNLYNGTVVEVIDREAI